MEEGGGGEEKVKKGRRGEKEIRDRHCSSNDSVFAVFFRDRVVSSPPEIFNRGILSPLRVAVNN